MQSQIVFFVHAAVDLLYFQREYLRQVKALVLGNELECKVELGSFVINVDRVLIVLIFLILTQV